MTAKAAQAEQVAASLHGQNVPVSKIGSVSGKALAISGEPPVAVADLAKRFEAWLPDYMSGSEVNLNSIADFRHRLLASGRQRFAVVGQAFDRAALTELHAFAQHLEVVEAVAADHERLAEPHRARGARRRIGRRGADASAGGAAMDGAGAVGALDAALGAALGAGWRAAAGGGALGASGEAGAAVTGAAAGLRRVLPLVLASVPA